MATQTEPAAGPLRQSPENSDGGLHLLLDNLRDYAIVLLDPEGHVTAWNKSAERLEGYRAEEIVGKHFSAFYPPEDTQRGKPEHELREAGEAGRFEEEGWRVRKDGSRFWANVIITPIRGEAGELLGFTKITRDLSERRQMDEQLQNTQAELRKAREAAEEANRAKSEFLASMSHEIRTPMNGIVGMTELTLGTELTPEQREYLTMVKASADSLLAVINDILDFSKIEARKLQLEAIDFSLSDTVGEPMKVLSLRAQQKGLELACHINPGVPEDLVGDPGRLRQILVNLVGNALKFTEGGEIVVDVQAEARPAAHAGKDEVLLHFQVSDTGIGIPPEKQRRIFDPFAQAEGGTARKYGGTGLGLAIGAQLVALMGGRIWVESEVGRGSTFHFTARFGLASRPVKRPPALQAVDLRGVPVLVVDDHAVNRRILEEMLGTWRMRPTAVESGRSALAALRQARARGEPFRLVILDGHMPEMDGFALAGQIQASPELAGTTIVMLTSAGQAGDIARCRELGIRSYLMKPVMQSDLLDALLTALGGSARARQPAGPGGPARAGTRPLRVLLAEDNLVNQKLAVHLLEKRGHSVEVAGSGREALAALERGNFDLVLMDVQMPALDGFETTAVIREKEKGTGRHIPIVAMTAHAMKGDRERCLSAGMDAYVSKPIQPQELFRVIEGLALGPAAEAVLPRGPSGTGEIDWAEVQDRVGGDPELLRGVVTVFLDECPRMMADVREAVAGRDVAGLKRAAHTLKGAVGIVGARAAAEAARRLESLGREGNLSQAEDAYHDLEEAIGRLEPALTALRAELEAGKRPGS